MSNEREVGSGPDRVWVSLDRKINLKPYESVGVGLGLAADVRPDQTREDAYVELLAEARRLLDVGIEVMTGS